jgi:hypothetical protein
MTATRWPTELGATFVRPDGSVPFVAPQTGVAGTDPTDLATRQQVVDIVAGSGEASDFATLTIAQATSIDAGPQTIRLGGRTSVGDGGGGLLRRVASNPGHAWSLQSADGAWWEFVPPAVTPEQGGFTDLAAAVTAINAVPAYGELVLDRRARTTSVYPLTCNARITGTGCDLVSYLGTEQRVGDDLRQSIAAHDPRHILQGTRRGVNLTRAPVMGATLLGTAAVSIPNTTATPLSASDYRDRCGAIDPSALGAFFIRSGWRRARFIFRGTWAASVTGQRQVSLTVNGTAIDSVSVSAVSGGLPTDQVCDFEIDVAAGQQIGFSVWHSAGAAINLQSWRATIEVIEEDIVAPPGERGWIYQSSWTALEVALGGYNGAVDHTVATKDVLILSGIETSNDDFGLFPQTPKKMWFNCVGPWALSTVYSVGFRVHDTVANAMYICLVGHTSPGSGTFAAYRTANPTHWRLAVPGDFPQVQGLGYPRQRRFIRDFRARRPDGEVYIYLSAAADAPYWDAGGNPLVQLTAASAGAYENVKFFLDQARRGGVEITGVFLDHAAIQFIDAVVLNNVISLCNARGLVVAYNITAAGVAPIRFITASGQPRPGHIWVCEGCYRDGGLDTSVQTNAMLAEIAKHRGRQMRLFFANEEASATPIVPNSTNDLNGRSLFDTFKRPGDIYQYGRTAYDTF